MIKRLFLFFATNLLVILTISIIISLVGADRYLTQHGINYQELAIFCGIWGFAGAFISLLFSKVIAKMAMGVVVIDPLHAQGRERAIIELIHSLAQKAGIRKMPEVGIYPSPELNAFATGPSKNNSLVAISSGLLDSMNRDEIEGVLSHEISHVANGDMVTMTLVQGVINSFALFLSRTLAYFISTLASKDEEREGGSYLLYSVLTIVFDVLFTFLGMILLALYSRHREYRADKGGALLVGKDKMIDALKRLQSTVSVEDNRAPSLNSFKINSKSNRFLELFSTHPSLENRIERLQRM